ncbi:hypothetical protein BDV59DRAFT_202699 [Aspergillus ambiguus]|uniref:uncharacterized protein n=1 Tax=Aspergillus ambiguus TaxID=176160 RepID=UPI003CCDEF60
MSLHPSRLLLAVVNLHLEAINPHSVSDRKKFDSSTLSMLELTVHVVHAATHGKISSGFAFLVSLREFKRDGGDEDVWALLVLFDDEQTAGTTRRHGLSWTINADEEARDRFDVGLGPTTITENSHDRD